MKFIKFLISKMHIIFVVVFILVLFVAMIFGIMSAIDSAIIDAVLSTPMSEVPFKWICLLVLSAVLWNKLL